MRRVILGAILWNFANAQDGKCYEKNRIKAQVPLPAPASDNECLSAHNSKRAAEGVPGLVWDSGLAAKATNWARYLNSIRSLQHSGSGENLYSGSSSCSSAVNAWYNEKPRFPGGSVSSGGIMSYGHFTQVIWAKTTKLGCGTAGNFVVCNYEPAGNMLGQSPYQK
jgi:pathogenesis-related protein 1